MSCSNEESIVRRAEQLRVQNNIPGMAVAVVMPDTILELFVLGYRQKGKRSKVEIGDRFHIGSNTKAMTAFVAATLVEKKMIDWSTRFIELYPDWKAEIDSLYWTVTLGDLLGHRGKIQRFWAEAEFDSIQIDGGSKSAQRNEFIRYALSKDPVTPDTLDYCYSNAGYTIAAQMLEKASGRSWEDLMLDLFNADLGLDIGFSWPNTMGKDQPWGHWTEEGKLYACPPDDEYDLNWLEPGGDVNISLPNYCKFIQQNMRGLEGNDNLLKSQTYERLLTDSGDQMYAYGWANFEKDGQEIAWHAGSAGTFLANAAINKSKSIAFIIMMNTNSPDAREVVEELRSHMLGIYGGVPRAPDED
ncbi:MAG: beta-lactamase family protein [Saprospiraceae bacterium]|nr:beta-lactamase family protein [Saprospiraceae bacterium]